MNGFLKLQRKFFSHWLWDQDRTYNQPEAFLDLLQFAAFAPTKRVVQGKLISLTVGELVASERFLEVRWKWSRTKVRHFLKLLESDRMLNQRKDQGQTVWKLSNYGKYMTKEEPGKTTKDTTDQTTEEPQGSQQETTGEPNKKKDKNSKKDNKPTVATTAIAWSPADGWQHISDTDLNEWSEAYPACDAPRQLKAMEQWLKANPAKAKKKAWRRFITGWLSREQDRGGDMRGKSATKERKGQYPQETLELP